MVQAERRERISTAQNEETRWADLKKFLGGEFGELTHKGINNAGKVADRFVLSEDGVLYYEGRRRETQELLVEDLRLRLVVPTTLIDEILLNCHDSIEGGHQGIVRTYHRVKADYYWIGLYADVVKHVQACEDCSTSQSKPLLKGYSPPPRKRDIRTTISGGVNGLRYTAPTNSTREHRLTIIPGSLYRICYR